MENLNKLRCIYEKLLGDSPTIDKNLFEMASLKEFRHSAILGYLLSRKEHGRHVHLESLVKDIIPEASEWNFAEAKVDCEFSVKVYERTRPIDILCRFDGKALIIENKCNGASDQYRQIADYWEGVKKLEPEKGGKYDDKDIYVLYLPPINSLTGPAEYSVGDLKFDDKLKDHLIVLSYRELILPWLKEDVLRQVCYGNGRLVDSLRSYIDLLEGAYGERSEQYDDRALVTKKLIEYLDRNESQKVDKPEDLWKKTDDLLTQIESFQTEDRKNVSEEKCEEDSRKIAELHAAVWRIRTFLREKNPVLDGANLIYEVYWMLRNNPTPFGAKNMKERLDSGIFFTNGRKGSIWDSRIVTIAGKKHTVEVVCDGAALLAYLKGEPSGNIITLGIGELPEGCPFFDELKRSYNNGVERLDNGWTKISIDNKDFEGVDAEKGGALLYEVAKRIAKRAKEFSERLRE